MVYENSKSVQLVVVASKEAVLEYSLSIHFKNGSATCEWKMMVNTVIIMGISTLIIVHTLIIEQFILCDELCNVITY